MPEKHMTEQDGDAVLVRDRSGRRKFIRSGAAFVLASGAIAASTRSALAADCDRNPAQSSRCSDEDSGEGRDPTGCGRCGREELVPSSMKSETTHSDLSVSRIKG